MKFLFSLVAAVGETRLFRRVRTACKPRANNPVFRDEKGVSRGKGKPVGGLESPLRHHLNT